MLNSRDISLLRADVAVNCRKWVERCQSAGLNVLVTNTVRDVEYQTYLYEQGRSRAGSIVTNAKIPTFHADTVGLAFDFCKNSKGHEYDDSTFFANAAAIAKEMGFSWGGDWKSFVDKPHIQWDNGGAVTDAMIRAGTLPPLMPEWNAPQENHQQPNNTSPENNTSQEKENSTMEAIRYNNVAECPEWAQNTVQKLVNHAFLTGDGTGLALSQDMVRLLVICDRAGVFGKE